MQKHLPHIFFRPSSVGFLHKVINNLFFTGNSQRTTANGQQPIANGQSHHSLFTAGRLLLTASCLLLSATASPAQQPVYIPPTGKVFSHPADSVGIFGDMTNDGNLGSAPGSVINFYGKSWENASTALLPGVTGAAGSPGGQFRFLGLQPQNLFAGYNFNAKTGPSFPNLSVENKSGVWLQDLNDLHVRNNLNFNKGYLYLNGWNTLVDQSVTGYSDKGFVVTGSGIGGGSLYREPPQNDTLMTFPVGTDPESYSPFAMQSATPFRGMVGATVFDNVYLHATSGGMPDSDYVMKSWQVTSGEGSPQTTVLLQHREADEGVRFAPYRDSSYVSLYRVDNGAWDMDPLPHKIFNPGTLTTGKQYNDVWMNNRHFPAGLPHQNTGTNKDSVNWLTVSTTAYSNTTCPVADFRLWVAQRYNYKWVQLFWRTLRELNVMQYEVQKRVDTSENFHTITTIPAKNVNGFSDHLLYYYDADSAIYDGTVYYRLKMTSSSGCVVYTNVQKVIWGIYVQVWPDPSPGPTNIHVYGVKHDLMMQVINTLGQILGTYTIPPNTDYMIDLSKLPDAIYQLYFRDPKQNGKIVASVKVVKITVR